MLKQGKGGIVATASTAGLRGDYGLAAYTAAKLVCHTVHFETIADPMSSIIKTRDGGLGQDAGFRSRRRQHPG